MLGSKTPRDCPSGLFTNTTRASVCQQCTAGYYCTPVNVTAGDPLSGYHLCPKGYYCPSGKSKFSLNVLLWLVHFPQFSQNIYTTKKISMVSIFLIAVNLRHVKISPIYIFLVMFHVVKDFQGSCLWQQL